MSLIRTRAEVHNKRCYGPNQTFSLCASWEGEYHQHVWIEECSCIYSVLWVYNHLVGCQTVPVINMEMNFSMEMMHVKDAQYLNNMEDAEQYSAASCNKGPGMCMHHWSTSVAVESTNAANRKMHSKSSVDPMNACILLMKHECK